MLKQTKDKYDLGKQMYLQDNLSLTQISKQLKIHRGRFADYLRQQNISITNKHNTSNIYSDIFEKIDSEEKAYWLGFLYADGCVSLNTNHIELALATCDSKHIEKFGKFLNFQGSIQSDSIRTRISFRNKVMHNDLIKLGCIPQKSMKMSFPNYNQVPQSLMIHFVRGYIDGDGYIGIHCHGFGRIGITCGSKEFVLDLINEMNWRMKPITKDKRSNALNCEWGGYYVTDMLRSLYEDASVYLDRKYQKFIEIENAVLS